MINSANKEIISNVFHSETPQEYEIPKYQREYTWSKDNWDALLNDIEEGDGNHFIGSIICIIDADITTVKFEVIDGQQRLTTLSLLLCAVYKLLSEGLSEDNEDMKHELWNLKCKIVNRKLDTPKLQLSEQNNNNPDYRYILSELKLISSSQNIKNVGNRKIYKAYKYFIDKLKDYSIENLTELLDKIGNTILVMIKVNNYSDAFLLFESLNNRGVPLTAMDLIKNKFLSKLTNMDNAFEKWNDRVVNKINDANSQERYLRHYYNTFKGEEGIKVVGYSKATRSNIIKIYDKLIDENTDFIFNELTKRAALYGDLLNPENSEDELIVSLKKPLIDLDHVKAASAYMLLLYLFVKHRDMGKEFLGGVITMLVKYFIRRNVVDYPATRDVDQIFMDVITEIQESPEKLTLDYLKEYFTNHSAVDEHFDLALRGNLYENNIDATRFILSAIEAEKRTKETETDFWAKDNKGKLIWTIEHIFPEGEEIKQHWVNMIANGDREKAIQVHKDYVHTLGNLTLTGYNSNLSDGDFVKKRDKKDPSGKNIGYKNNLFLNEDLKNKETRTEEDIIERGEKLVKIALEKFRI